MLLADAADGPRGTIVGGMGRVLEALRESGLPVCFAPGVRAAHDRPRSIARSTASTWAPPTSSAPWRSRCGTRRAAWTCRTPRPRSSPSRPAARSRPSWPSSTARSSTARAGRAARWGSGRWAPWTASWRTCCRDFSKDVLASGGAAWIAGTPRVLARGARRRRGERRLARRSPLTALLEDVAKRVAAEAILLEAPREILLSGRLVRVPGLRRRLVDALQPVRPGARGRRLRSVCSEAAQGAALLGQGLAGDADLSELVDAMDLRSACGGVLDHLFVSRS